MNIKLGLMGAMLVGGTAVAADGIKLGGFVNPAYTWTRVQGGADGNTFEINDAAIYLGKTLGTGEVLIDIPFRSGVSTDTRAGAATGLAATAAEGTDNALVAGFEKAQAYVQWKYENGFMWKLGQFDSMYGVEANDSADRFFSEAGVMRSTLPTTHSGLVVGYDFSDALAFHLMVANPANTGLMTDGNPDYGVKIATNTDGMKAGVGLLISRPAGGDAEWLVDVVAGTQMDQLTADLEATVGKGDSAAFNPATGAGSFTGTGDETAFGIGLHLAYGMTEEIKAGLRAEYKKIGDTKLLGLAVGPKFGMSKDFDVGVEYFMGRVDTVAGDETSHAVSLSAVHRF